jgi:hypothetical protein
VKSGLENSLESKGRLKLISKKGEETDSVLIREGEYTHLQFLEFGPIHQAKEGYL